MNVNPDESCERVVVVVGNGISLAQQVQVGVHCFSADEPLCDGGDDSGPSPYDLLLGALGACTSMTITMYARRKEWPLEQVIIRLDHQRVGEGSARVNRIDREIELTGSLSEEQKARLILVAEKCPVHRTLLHEVVEVDTRLI